MDIPESEFVTVIYHLLPGFTAAWVFYGLTAHPKASPFERIVQALIFTAVTQAIVIPVRALVVYFGDDELSLGVWTENSSFVLSMIVAFALGVGFSSLANTNWLHSRLPDWITKRTSFPSEWFSAFNQDKRYVYLHLTGQRRIFGWPTEWPDQTDKGHFVLQEAAWITDDNQRAPLHLTERMLIPASEVVVVEFEKFEEERTHTDEQLESSIAILMKLQDNEESTNE